VNLLEQQASNRRRSWLVAGVFVAFLFLLGLGFDAFYLGLDSPIPVGALGGLAVGSVSALTSYYTGDRAALRSTGAVPLETALASAGSSGADAFKLTQLQNVVDEMSIASGLPRPKVYVIDDDDPNAFATGRDPEHASIAVTRGLLDALGRDELQGVVAHEMSHVRNYDIRLMTLIAALVGAVALLSDWAGRGMRTGRGGRRSRNGKSGGGLALVLLAIWLVAIVLAPLIGRLLAMAVSRRREYLADASGAELTRNPGALADALERIEGAAAPTRSVKRGTAHLCIADPLGRAANLKEGFWADLFASHPPMERRIAALRAMAYERAG
jgi:heat shock protein HtpX